MANLWPAASLLANIVMALVIYSLKSTIRIAILEALQGVASKGEMKDLESRINERIALGERVDSGFERTFALLRERGDRGAASSSPMVGIRK